MKELSLTKGRHEIKSVFTGELVEKSIFGHTVEDILDIDKHIDVAKEAMFYTEPFEEDIVVYVTGLTPLFQAVFAAWLYVRCGPPWSLDMPRGTLTFAHYDRDTDTYVLVDALTGQTKQKPVPYTESDK